MRSGDAEPAPDPGAGFVPSVRVLAIDTAPLNVVVPETASETRVPTAVMLVVAVELIAVTNPFAFTVTMGIAEALSKDVRDDKGAALYFLPVSAGLDLSK
jgi:S1-C subfamily serine protease